MKNIVSPSSTPNSPVDVAPREWGNFPQEAIDVLKNAPSLDIPPGQTELILFERKAATSYDIFNLVLFSE